MDLLEVMTNRRSVRSYTEEEIPAEKLEKILQAGLLAESGKNLKPWEFIVVEDREVLAKMAWEIRRRRKYGLRTVRLLWRICI